MRKVLAILESMTDKRLAKGFYQYDGVCCAVGACIPGLRELNSYDNSEPIKGLARRVGFRGVINEAVKDLGVSVQDLENLQMMNDMFEFETDSERYQRVLTAVREKCAQSEQPAE